MQAARPAGKLLPVNSEARFSLTDLGVHLQVPVCGEGAGEGRCCPGPSSGHWVVLNGHRSVWPQYREQYTFSSPSSTETGAAPLSTDLHKVPPPLQPPQGTQGTE